MVFEHRCIVPECFWIYKASAKLCSRRMVRNLLRMRAAHDALVLPFVETSHRRCQTLNHSGCYTECIFCCLPLSEMSQTRRCRTLNPGIRRLRRLPGPRQRPASPSAGKPTCCGQPEGHSQWTNVTALASPRAARLHAPRQRRSPRAAYCAVTVTLLECYSDGPGPGGKIPVRWSGGLRDH